MLQQGLLNAGMIMGTSWLAVVPPLPEADLALVNAKCCSKAALGQASQHTSGAELTSGDQVGGSVHFVAPLGPPIDLRNIEREEHLFRYRNYTNVFVLRKGRLAA